MISHCLSPSFCESRVHVNEPLLLLVPCEVGQRQQKDVMVGKGFRKGRKGKSWVVDTNQLWGTADL